MEFAVKDGVPYAIDFMNPAPDADLHSVGRESFDWIVDRVAKLAVKKAQMSESFDPEMNWRSFLTPPMVKKPEAKTPARKVAKKEVVAKKAAKKAAKRTE